MDKRRKKSLHCTEAAAESALKGRDAASVSGSCFFISGKVSTAACRWWARLVFVSVVLGQLPTVSAKKRRRPRTLAAICCPPTSWFKMLFLVFYMSERIEPSPILRGKALSTLQTRKLGTLHDFPMVTQLMPEARLKTRACRPGLLCSLLLMLCFLTPPFPLSISKAAPRSFRLTEAFHR